MLRQLVGMSRVASRTVSSVRALCSSNGELNLNEQVMRRAMLYCPGDDQHKINKVMAIAHSVDCIVLDCEDGVAMNKKDHARNTIVDNLNRLYEANRHEQLERIAVRINSVESNLAEQDLKTVFAGNVVPRTLLLPKVESAQDIDWFINNVLILKKEQRKAAKARGEPLAENSVIDLIIYVESARGLLDLREICTHACELDEYSNLRLAGIVFGSDDFCASIGATRTDNGRELLFARQSVVLVARSLNLQAIDSVYINFKDAKGLEDEAREGASFGFTGKQAIHPAQVSIIQQAFAPSDHQIEWATQLIVAFNQAQQEGKGAFVFRGAMIDMPLLRQAANIVNIAKRIGKA